MMSILSHKRQQKIPEITSRGQADAVTAHSQPRFSNDGIFHGDGESAVTEGPEYVAK
jgi:hypothetical protein